MNIRYLQIFIAVVEKGTMSAASEELHMTQPSISHAILEMEKFYGVRLFDRLSKRLYLTETGEELLPYARHIVSTFENMEVVLKNAAAHPIVKIGSTAVFSSCFLPEIAHRIERSAMNIQLGVTVTNTRTVESMLLKSKLDLGIVEGTVESPDIISEHLMTDQLCLVCGRSHPLYGKIIRMKDLNGISVISREDYSFLTRLFDSIAKENGIHYTTSWNCSGNDAIFSAVVAGHGIAAMSSCMVADKLASGEMYAIPVLDMTFKREIFLVYHQSKFHYPALEESIRICKDYVNEVIQQEKLGHRYVTP